MFLLILTTIIILLNEVTEYIVNKSADFKLKSNPEYIVLGHSHPETAFNDSLINDFVNISQSGESYFYNYFKAKKIIDHNPSIKVVFLEFSNNQIDISMNNGIWKTRYMRRGFPIYSPFMDYSHKSLLIRNNFTGYLTSMAWSIKTNLVRTLTFDFDYSKTIGGYLHLERNKTDSLINEILYSDIVYNFSKISDKNLKYLERIVNYSIEKGKKVILIRSPVHEKYIYYTNEEKYKEIKKIKFPHLEYLDFSKFPLQNSEFGDFQHLNYKGAEIFSVWFSKLLQNGLMESNCKEEFVEKEIEELIRVRTYYN